jgi:predicted transcriptional regulator
MQSVPALLRAKPFGLITADPLSSVTEALHTMRQETVRSILIMKESKLAGIMANKDYLRDATALGKNPEAVRAEAIILGED